MNADLPEEWFRARERGQVTPPDMGGASDDERFTDQFKPGYIPRPGQPGEADDGAGVTHFNPVRAEATASAARTSAAPVTSPEASEAPGGARTEGSSAGLQGSFGENSAGATFSVGEVRRPQVPRPRRLRGRRVRVIIQSAIVLVVALAAGLIGGSYLAARNQSSSVPAPGGTTTGPSAAVASDAAPYSGPLKLVSGVKASAQCTAENARDASGHLVSYQAANMVDGLPQTAWRCPGAALGQRLTFTLPAGTTLVGLGIVNGYSKNATDGTDYYERFRRVLRVQWTINGRTAVQTLTDHRESEQTITIAPLRVSQPVVLTIQQTSDPGQSDSGSNATLLSTVSFYTSGS